MGLKRRSRKLVAALNELEGVTCNEAQGAMYAFPQIRLPAKALAAAEAEGRKGTTFLPSEKDIDSVVDRVTQFHKTFMRSAGTEAPDGASVPVIRRRCRRPP